MSGLIAEANPYAFSFPNGECVRVTARDRCVGERKRAEPTRTRPFFPSTPSSSARSEA